MTRVNVTIVNEEKTYFLRYQACVHHRQMSAALVLISSPRDWKKQRGIIMCEYRKSCDRFS